MCITSLPYCPPHLSHKIPALLYDAATSSTQIDPPQPQADHTQPTSPNTIATTASTSTSSPTTTTTTTTWFICSHPNLTSISTSTSTSTSPSTCPNLEIRHPGFNGVKCVRCTQLAVAAAAAVSQEGKMREAMVEKLREEIERLEGVVRNMRRKLGRLEERRNGVEGEVEKDGDGETGRKRELKEVLEGSLGSGWGGVL